MITWISRAPNWMLAAALIGGGGIGAARASLATPSAPPVILHVGDRLSRFDLLKPATRRYLRYDVRDGRRSAIDIWTREVSFPARGREHDMRIRMRWDEVGAPPLTIEQDAMFELGTFRPSTHIRRRQHGDTVTIGGYRFLPDRIVGMDELPDNTRKGFLVESNEPAFDFEYDMELLQALPLAEDYAVSIQFYDPGVNPPARYVFRVAGSDVIQSPDGGKVPCWVVTADYNTGHVVSRFWFAKKTQVLIREEALTADGIDHVKILLPPESGDMPLVSDQ